MKQILIAVVVLMSTVLAFAQGSGRQNAGDAKRGKYFVENVAMCIECHTPRDSAGQLIRDKYLEGAPVPVKSPPFPDMKWALRAPAIAGLPGYTSEEGIRLLTQGVTVDGRRPNPPMPPFRFTQADAQAIVAYLKSLQ